MNTTTFPLPQASTFALPAGFPQLAVEQLVQMPAADAVSKILDLFDAERITSELAEALLITIENLHV